MNGTLIECCSFYLSSFRGSASSAFPWSRFAEVAKSAKLEIPLLLLLKDQPTNNSVAFGNRECEIVHWVSTA